MNTYSTDVDELTPWARLRELIQASDTAAVRSVVASLSPSEAVHTLFRFDPEEQEQLIELLEPEQAAALLADVPDSHAATIIERLEVAQAADIVDELDSEQGADLLGALGEREANAILDEMAPKMAVRVRGLIGYSADVAGGLMGIEHFAYSELLRVGDFLDDFRRRRSELDQLPQRIVLVDAEHRPSGAVEIADLLIATPETRLTAMRQGIAPIRDRATLDEIDNYFERYETLGAPVVDDAGRLVGRLRLRALLEALDDRAQADQLKVQGIIGGEELRALPIATRSRRRLSWLSVNILLNILAASVIAFFQDTVSAVIALAVFLPIVSDMSGCSGNQAVAVSMRELTLGIINPRDVLRVWWQEVSVGLINGIALGSLLAVAAYLWQGNGWLGAVVGLALGLNTIIAVSIGGTVPLLLKACQADPAIASGPVLTTVTDMCGFFLVLGLATLALPLLTA